ncbi:uncharacterized protein LOC135215214 [Macrobrachium nipponense]|uniref:uncharacterized protein LOC135215214 n=1 Tax=Macrobrachium nipponense TaxID=159736 RepID=UPI0030C8805E
MAAWLQAFLSFGVITTNAAVATTSGEASPVAELSLSLSSITDFPQIKLYTSQTHLSDKINFETNTHDKTAKQYHNDKIHTDYYQDNDTFEVTVLPTSTILWKKVKKAKPGGGANLTDDGDVEDEFGVGMPVAAALQTSGNGRTRDDGTYIVDDDEGTACVMAYFKCQATIYYPDTKGTYQKKVVSPEDDSEVYGSCDRVGQVSEVSVKWSSIILTLRFGLDDLTDSWFVSRFSLTYDLSASMFPDSAGSSTITVASKDGRKFWQTNNEYSFRCLLLHDISLLDINNNTATLHFDEVRVQAFCDEAFFRRPKHCIHRVHRDEMVPVTVGATLAGSTLLTVIVYGIFRYFKIKKVQYDTMA